MSPRIVAPLTALLILGCGGDTASPPPPETGATRADPDDAAPRGTARSEKGSSVPERPCGLPAPPKGAPVSTAIARTHASARAGYDSIGARFEIVGTPFPDTSGCTPTPHRQGLTNAPAYAKSGPAAAPFTHLTRMTFWTGRDPANASPAVGELYLHGAGDEVGYVVVRGLDLRKFLFQDVVLHDCAANPASCDPERLPGPDNVWAGAEPAPDGFANEPFDSDRFGCIRNVHGYFAEFNRITKKIRALTPSTDPERLHLTNNCREPGNYELALVSSGAGTVWKNHVSLDMEFYRTVLADIGVNHQDLGTGLRLVGLERKPDGSYAYEQAAPKDFPDGCSIANLAPYIGKAQRLRTPRPIPVALELGPIPYPDFSEETNAKSGKRSDESIVYAEVIPGRPGPSGWRSAGFHFRQDDGGPVLRVTEDAAWTDLTQRARGGTRIWAPHTFASFRDVQAHPFSISAFEVDGRYLGRLKDERLATDAARLYAFDYRWLDGLRRVEVREAVEPNGGSAGDPIRLEFRLLNRRCGKPGKDCINLIIGNIALVPGEETSMVLGIGTQPLRDRYERQVLQDAQQYALTYDEHGAITELVGEYGLGLVVVRRDREDPREFTFDLVSYERAVPLWRGRVRIP